MATVGELRQILKEDSAGKNLYDHLTETLMKLLLDRPGNAYENFEFISAAVKETPLDPNPSAGRPVPDSAELVAKKEAWARAALGLFQKPDEAPAEGVKYPDLMDDATLLEWAGLSLGKGDMYRLYLSIKKLCETLPGEVEGVRLFGKVNTRTSPYYVLEGKNPEDQEGVDEALQEGRSGVNKFKYWVASSVEAAPKDWRALPNVTCEQIVKSKQFKKLLSGNLDGAVFAYPPFPGNEKELLRAQIARITAATSISPDGFWGLDDDGNVKIAEAEAMAGAFPKAAGELTNPDAWKHHEKELNILGRITKMPPAMDADGNEIPSEVEEIPNLESAKQGAWAFRACPGGAGSGSFSLVVARSITWPGAAAVYNGKSKFINIYIGNGVVYEEGTYTPPLPQALMTEYTAKEETDLQLMEQPDTKVDPTPPAPEVPADE